MKQYTVFWINALTGENTQHGTYNTSEEAFKSIIMWWNINNYEPYYIRSWKSPKNPNVTIIDYGSHIHFYHIVESEVDSANPQRNK